MRNSWRRSGLFGLVGAVILVGGVGCGEGEQDLSNVPPLVDKMTPGEGTPQLSTKPGSAPAAPRNNNMMHDGGMR